MKVIYRVQANGNKMYYNGQGKSGDFIEWAQDNLQLVPAHRVDAVVKLFKKTSQFNHQPLYVADFETKGEQV